MAAAKERIVWAKLAGHPSWPAQALPPDAALADEELRTAMPSNCEMHIPVQFFGDCSKAWVPHTQVQSWESGCGSGNLLGPSLDLAAAIMKAHAYLSCGKAYPGWMTQAQQRDAGAGAAGGSELEGRGSAAAAAGSMQAAGGSELEARGSAAAAAGSMQATDGSGQAAVGSGQVAGTSRPVASGSSPAAGRKRRGDAAAMVRSSTRSAAQDGHFAAQLEQPAAASTPAQAAKRPRLQQPGPSEGGTTLSVAAGAAAGAGPTAAAGAAAAAAGKCQAAAGSSSSFMDQLEAATEEAAAAASGLTPELADAFAKLARPDVAGLGYLLRHLRYYEVVRALEKQLQDAGVSVPKPA